MDTQLLINILNNCHGNIAMVIVLIIVLICHGFPFTEADVTDGDVGLGASDSDDLHVRDCRRASR